MRPGARIPRLVGCGASRESRSTIALGGPGPHGWADSTAAQERGEGRRDGRPLHRIYALQVVFAVTAPVFSESALLPPSSAVQSVPNVETLALKSWIRLVNSQPLHVHSVAPVPVENVPPNDSQSARDVA